jgi:hypothetical protein
MENEGRAGHIPDMSNGIKVTVHFFCPCGLHYTATQQRRPNTSSGSFKCQGCRKTVYEWRGNFDYWGWETQATVTVRPSRPA